MNNTNQFDISSDKIMKDQPPATNNVPDCDPEPETLPISKKTICSIAIIVILLTSMALNIYWGIQVYKKGDLNIQRKSIVIGQSCQIVQYNVSMLQAGTIINSNPDCAKNYTTSLRLLTICEMYTPTNVCLYCTQRDYQGTCIELSTQDPNGSIIPGLVQKWIKCMIRNIATIVYGLQKCTILGLQELVVDTVDKAFSAGQIAGISSGGAVGLLCLCCLCYVCSKM